MGGTTMPSSLAAFFFAPPDFFDDFLTGVGGTGGASPSAGGSSSAWLDLGGDLSELDVLSRGECVFCLAKAASSSLSPPDGERARVLPEALPIDDRWASTPGGTVCPPVFDRVDRVDVIDDVSARSSDGEAPPVFDSWLVVRRS